MITVIVPIRLMSPARPHAQTQGRMDDGGVSDGFIFNAAILQSYVNNGSHYFTFIYFNIFYLKFY